MNTINMPEYILGYIADCLDTFSEAILSPFKDEYSDKTKNIRYTFFIAATLCTLATVPLLSVLWQGCRPISKRNKAQERINNLFHQTFSSPTTLLPENMRTLVTFLKEYCSSSGHYFEFTKDNENYYAWFSSFYDAVSIQSSVSFNRGMANNKLGVQFDLIGNPISIQIDGISVTCLSEQNKQLLSVAYEKIPPNFLTSAQPIEELISVSTPTLDPVSEPLVPVSSIDPLIPISSMPIVVPLPTENSTFTPELPIIPTLTSPVVPNSNPESDSFCEQMSKLVANLTENSFFLFSESGKTYCTWLNTTHSAINIQLKKDYNNRSFNNKLGVRFDAMGNSISIQKNGLEVTSLSQFDKNLLLSAYRNRPKPAITSVSLTSSLLSPTAVTPPALQAIKKLASYLKEHFHKDENVFGFDFKNEHFYSWFESNPFCIYIQLKSNYEINKSIKLSIKIDSEGNPISLNENGENITSLKTVHFHWLIAAQNRISSLFLDVPVLQARQMVKLFNELKSKYSLSNRSTHNIPQGEKIFEFIENGKTYFAWYSGGFKAVNIQHEKSFVDKDYDNKIGIQCNESGEVTSVQENAKSVSFSIQHKRLLFAANEQLNNPEALTSITTFQKANFSVFVAVLKNKAASGQGFQTFSLDFRGIPYLVWCSANSTTINLQREDDHEYGLASNKFEIQVNKQSEVTSVKINGIKKQFNLIPIAYTRLLHVAFEQALRLSSTYKENGQMIDIHLVKKSLKEVPEFHLQKISHEISKKIKTIVDPKIFVKFLDENLKNIVGIDAGGLSRDYFDDLFIGLTQSKQLSFNIISLSSLLVPRSKEGYKNGSPLPQLRKQEQEYYKHIGQLMIYCFHSKTSAGFDKTYSTGRHFDDALFNAALCLSAEEVNTSFENLSLQSQLKMFKALVISYEQFPAYEERIRLLSLMEWNNANLEDAATQADYAGLLPDNLLKINGDPDMEKIANHPDVIKNCLIDSLFGVSQEEQGQLGLQLAPIHAIAQGMLAGFSQRNLSLNNQKWNSLRQETSSLDMSNKIQGSINRDEIVNNIVASISCNSEIKKKIKWLKEWIKEEASPQQLKLILKFMTGSSSFPKDKQIKVHPQPPADRISLPRAHTCSLQIDLSPVPTGNFPEYNDHTKEDFIKGIVDVVLTDPGSYSMA